LIRFLPPRVPWQLTGNHWLAIPCIHPADGSVHAVGMVNRSARAAVEFAGSADFVNGGGEPLLRPVLRVNGERRDLASGGMAWERAFGWIPTFTSGRQELVVRGTIFTPYGRDADVAGVVYAFTIENRGAAAVDVDLSLEGVLGHRQQRIRSARPFADAHRVAEAPDAVILLDGAGLPSYAALAAGADAAVKVSIRAGAVPRWTLSRSCNIASGGREELAFYIGAGPERDGAEATVAVMRRRGWRELLRATRAALQGLSVSTGSDALDTVVNRNLLFAYFYAVARALDDAHFYPVRTRSPWNSHGLVLSEWEALAWTIPAVQLADPELARELIVRMCEVHGYAPGSGIHYMDGTLFEAGFMVEGAAGYALAVDSYIAHAGDEDILQEPSVAETLYACWEDIESRRDGHLPLYSTEVNLSGSPAAFPYTVHANAVVAQALDVFRRTLDEKTAERVEDPEAVRTALRERFAAGEGDDARLRTAIDLLGAASGDDDPVSSVLWLPLHGAISRDAAVYKNTIKALEGKSETHLTVACARLLGAKSKSVLEWLRRAPLDNGLAAEIVDAGGRVVANGGDAALAGLLAYSIWQATSP
jgi:hypothetical protein